MLRKIIQALIFASLIATIFFLPKENRELILNVALLLMAGMTGFSYLVFGIMRTLFKTPARSGWGASWHLLYTQSQIWVCALLIGVAAAAILMAVGPIAPRNTVPVVISLFFWCSALPFVIIAPVFKDSLRTLQAVYPFLLYLMAGSYFILATTQSPVWASLYYALGSIFTSCRHGNIKVPAQFR